MDRFGRLLNIGQATNQTVGAVSRLDGSAPTRLEKFLASAFRGYALMHPCIGARSVLVNGGFYFSVIENMRDLHSAIDVVLTLEEYLLVSDNNSDPVKTCALFFVDNFSSQLEFAQSYWSFMQLVHDFDSLRSNWDETVSSDPQDPSFELSIAGRAFFTTTLNPMHTRPARRFQYPVWVCNQTAQFNLLRQQGQFEFWQKSIRRLDADLDPSGQHNPILTDHGYASAAQQLAGSIVDPCPLIVRSSFEEKKRAARNLISSSIQGDLDSRHSKLLLSRVSPFLEGVS